MNSSQKLVYILIAFTSIALPLLIRSVTAILPITSAKTFNCTFDLDLCGWTQAKDDDFDWERSRNNVNDADTGPAHDHTGDGFYMVVNAKDYTQTQNALLVSPFVNITSNQQKCFQFYYLMHGAQVGTLNIYLSSDGSPDDPVWSRIGTQGIFYLLGQVTLKQSGMLEAGGISPYSLSWYGTCDGYKSLLRSHVGNDCNMFSSHFSPYICVYMVYIEGSGSSGNDGDVAIDDVSLSDGACISVATHNSYKSLACDFELDLCGYANAPGTVNGSNWHRAFGESLMLEDTFDHTTRTAAGAFITIDGSSIDVNKRVSLVSENITSQGSYCFTFFYRKQGLNAGSLSASVQVYSNNITTRLWQDKGLTVADQWNKVQISLNITSVIQLSFDATTTSSVEDADLSIDDISVLNGTCETPPKCSFDRYDLCSWVNDVIHDDFDWEITTSGGDAKIFAPYRDADDNAYGGFILLDMASNPTKEEAYLVSEVITTKGVNCFIFYFYPMIRSAQFEGSPIQLNIYVNTGGDFPGTLYWTYSMTHPSTTFMIGNLPLQINNDYRIIIGGIVALGQVLSLDKFSLATVNCSYTPPNAKPLISVVTSTTTVATLQTSQASSSSRPHSLWDCDFETDSCHWKSDQTASSTWTRRQPGFYLNGPHYDHTTGPGGLGYFLTLDTASGTLQTDTALKANTSYCLVFWYYLYGNADLEFTVQTIMGTSSTTLMSKQNSVGTVWHQMTLNLPTDSTPFNIQFLYQQMTPGTRNQLALDDIQVYEGICSLEVGPNCTFDRGFCNWGNSKDSDFNFTLSIQSGQDSGEIQSDHTTETDLGSFIKAVSGGHLEGQKAHFESSKLKFYDSVCMRYYYFITSSCDSEFSIETLGPQDKHSVPLLDMPDVIYGSWQLGQVTVYDPQDTQVIFTVTVGQNGSCEIGFDDVEFVHGECLYTGTTDFENGFDVYHNVYSNDFNWVIASPSDGIYTWLPVNDFSTNSPNGHLAVATYTFSSSLGKKAELWGQLSPPMASYCTSFYFYVWGNNPGVLNVTLVDYLDDSRTVVWSYTPPPRNMEEQIYAQFPNVYPRQFYVVFTVILGSDGDWAIDSIDTFPSVSCRVIPAQAAASTVAPQSVPTTPTLPTYSPLGYGDCDFESDLCNWTIPEYSDFNWTRTSGDPDLQFSPQQGRPGGKKYFLTLPMFSPEKEALLQSPVFNQQPAGNGIQRRFSFRLWLNMNGEHVGLFAVEIDTATESSVIFTASAATDSWEKIVFVVSVKGPFSLIFHGKRSTYDSDSISIDDIEVFDTIDLDYDTVYRCTFESSDLCGFKQDSSNNLDWLWIGNQPYVLLQDHTYMTSDGHAMLVNHTQGKPGDIARLISKTVQPMSGCLTFWLLMISDGAALRVYLTTSQQEELILQRRDTQGYVWTKSEVPISSNMPFSITLEAEVLADCTSDLAIDDFVLSSSACDTAGACTFERDTCTWQNSLISGANFDWIRGTGNTVGVTGPAVDSTIASADGYYMYIDSSGPFKYQDKAWFDSETFAKGEQCIHFHYYMSGVSVGTLNVYTLVLDSVNFVMMWSLSGDQGSDWNSAMVTVGTNLVNYYVRFEGVLGYSVISNIAIDDIIFLPGACKIQPPEANAFSIVSTTPTTSTNPSFETILQRCDFDNSSLCGFKNGTSDNYWVLAGPNMSVSDTLRPFNGHTSNRNNSFIYAQIGDDLKENSTARLISPTYAAFFEEPKCLEFYYHMNGDQVGQLNVYIAPDGQENSLTKEMCFWSQDFDAGPGWKKGLVPIDQPSNYHVVFEVIRSKVDYYYGIDDLTIFDYECEPSGSCDFEEDICLWSNEGGETDSKFYWSRYRGRDRTALFAPTVDHTSQTVDGYYMFVESSLTDADSVARLYSQVFDASSSPYCFHFWYYMFGPKLGQLKVFVRNSISSSSYYSDADLWQLNNPEGNGWFLAQVNISTVYTKKPFMVIIEAAVGTTLQGAFGVDDTQFETADCETQPHAARVTADAQSLPDCDFDDGDTCDWTSLSLSTYTFTVVSAGGIIPFDHNGGTGKFLLADCKKLPPKTVVIIQSPLLPPTYGTSCLTLWYNLQMSGQSDLTLSLVTVDNEIPLWKVYSEDGNGWMSTRINIQSNFDYKLVILATVGTFDAGSVAVDDISLKHGACQRSAIITFEDGLSGFLPTASTNIKWVLTSASDSFIYNDHSTQTAEGHILQADLSTATTDLKIAEVKSPLYPPVGDQCLNFYYSKKGSSGGWLSVKISETGPGFASEDSDTLWLTTADTKGEWKEVFVDVSSEYQYSIVFQAAANNSQVSDVIVIDDISFNTISCHSDVNCDFDNDVCGYTISTDDVFIWKAVKGIYPDSLMPFDKTFQTDQGTYFEVDFPSTLNTYTADLISPVETHKLSTCLLFWYCGYGEGTLQVFTQNSSNQRQSVVTETISADMNVERQFRGWKMVQADVNSTAPYSIVFEAKNYKPDTSFAIDTIKLFYGTCAKQTETSHESTGSLLDPKTAMLGCDFEKSDFCNFSSDSSRTFGWKMFSFNSSHSPGTGVDFDHTKDSKYGHHVYMDASGQKFNTTALLISPSFINDKFVCLSFYYAMFGRDVNRLNVYISQGQTKTLFWTRSENQGEEWHHQMVDIGQSPQSTQVIFEGVVGRSEESDIDLDDIWIFDGRCPPPEYCDFEDSEICKMDQDSLNDVDWVIQSAALATGSEPKTDHTYGTEQGNYLLLNMPTTKSDQMAKIFTQQYDQDSARCLTFWFHFTNPANLILIVSLRDEGGEEFTITEIFGSFKEEWIQGIYTLESTTNFQIVFEGLSHGSKGNIALDDIRVSPDECKSYIDCDFESHDKCGWDIVPDHSTPPWEVIPPYHYMTLNFSDVHSSIVQISQVQSQMIPPGMENQFCFTFSYMMYGTNIGYLNISVQVQYPVQQTIVIFSIYGDQGRDTWRYAYGENQGADIRNARFVITGSTAAVPNSTDTSVILMSDIVVPLETCDEWVTQKEAFFPCSVDFQIPVSSICDYIDDCVGNLDEINCGACNFEKDYCNWEDDSTGAQKFTAISAIPNMVFTDSHPGIFLTVQRADGNTGGTGDLVLNQELGPSPYNCTMVFSYYLSTDSQATYGNLYVSMEENNEETVIWESSQGNITTWQTASVDIGNIKSRFKLHFASKYLPFDNAVGIDDITFKGCSFAVTAGKCTTTQFACTRSGACIDSTTKLCDFTDECGDSSDEDPTICANYLMDDFEESFGDWSQDGHDDFDWSRHSGRWISSSSGPRRDHTLGTHFGHYLIFEGGTHVSGQVARLISPEFLPTTSDCKIRFYYHMHGSDRGQLTLYLYSKTTQKMQQLAQFFTKINDAWLFGSSNLTSIDNFQVIFEGRVLGEHSTDTGLDDITFTPQCQLKDAFTQRPRRSTTVAATKSIGLTSTQSAATTKAGVTAPAGETSKSVTTITQSPRRSTTVAATKSIGLTSTQSAATTKAGVTAPAGETSKSVTTITQRPRRSTTVAATKSIGLTSTQSATTTKASVTPPAGETSKSVTTSKFVTAQTGGTSKSVTTRKSVTAQTGNTSKSKTTVTSVATESQSSMEGHSADSSSDSWKVPVGVILGLVGVVAIIAGVIIYLHHTRTLKWLTFPLFRKSIKPIRGESNPVFEYFSTGDTTLVPMSEQKELSGSIKEIFGESTEPAVMSDSFVGLSSPTYTET